MSTLKENLVKIGFKADEADTILEKMPDPDQQSYSNFSMPELALKAGNFRNQYLKKAAVLKNKLTIPGASEEDTNTMTFKRSALPGSAVDANSATGVSKPALDMEASGIVTPSPGLQKTGTSINLQKPGGSLLDSNIAPAKPAPTLNKPGSNLQKPGNNLSPEEDADMGIPTMSFKRATLPGAAKEVSHSDSLSKTPGSSLSALNNASPAPSPPGAKSEFKLKGSTLKKPSENKAPSDNSMDGMDLNTMTMSKSAILGNAVDISSDQNAKKPGSSLASPETAKTETAPTPPSDQTPEVVPPKTKPKLALKGNKGMITPPGSGLELPKPGSSSKAPGITTPGSGIAPPPAGEAPSGGLKPPGGLQAPGGGLKPPGGLQAPGGGLKPPGGLQAPSGQAPPPPPPPGGLSLKSGEGLHSPGDLTEGHDKKLSLNSPTEDVNETAHEDVNETVTTSLNKLKKGKPSKGGKKPLIVMVAIGVLLLGGIAFLVTSLLGGSDEVEVAKKEEAAPAKAEPKKKAAPKVEEKFKTFDIPDSREWAYRTASSLKFDLKSEIKETWSLELWLNTPEPNSEGNPRVLSLKSKDDIVLLLKLNQDNLCSIKVGEETHKAPKAFRSGKAQYHLALTCKNKEILFHINGRYIAKAPFEQAFDNIVLGSDKTVAIFDELILNSSTFYLADENFVPSRTTERNEDTILYVPFEATKDTAQLNIYHPKEIATVAIDSEAWLNIKQSVLDISALLSELDSEIIDDIEDEGTAVR